MTPTQSNPPAQTDRPHPSGKTAPDLRSPIHADTTAVVGLQWGDEGKGKVIDALAGNFNGVVRYNGGANAGHSVVIKGKRHALHLIPSGIFRPEVAAIIANGVVVDPLSLLDEIDNLERAGVSTENLILSQRAHLVLPWHKSEDAAREALLAGSKPTSDEQTTDTDHSIGTTKRGIGPAYADKAGRSTAIRAIDLTRPEVLRDKLRRISPLKAKALNALDPNAPTPDPQELEDSLLDAGRRLAPRITDTTYLLHEMLRSDQRILFEGANATLLDIDHGTFPFVTSSSTTALGIPAGTGLPPHAIGDIIGVLKAYSTRVGAGPFPTELNDPISDRIRERGREYGTTTGRPRRCGWLDLVAARYAAMINGATALSVMLFDVLAGFDQLKLATAYEIDGERTDRFLPDAHDLQRVTPIYETLPGFAEEITEARTLTDLPTPARRYLERIEELIGVPIHLVSVGPDREQTIHRH